MIEVYLNQRYLMRNGKTAKCVKIGLDRVNADNRLYAEMESDTGERFFVRQNGTFDFHDKPSNYDLLYMLDGE